MKLTKGHKCYFLGENICGDGIHSREELANKIKSQKVVNVINPDVLAKGFKEHHNGENIIGDGVKTRDELADELKAKKVKPKRGVGTMVEPKPKAKSVKKAKKKYNP